MSEVFPPVGVCQVGKRDSYWKRVESPPVGIGITWNGFGDRMLLIGLGSIDRGNELWRIMFHFHYTQDGFRIICKTSSDT